MRYIISIWPAEHQRKALAMVKITFDKLISVYPISVLEGKNGMRVSFRRTGPSFAPDSPSVSFFDKTAKEKLTANVVKVYHPDKSSCHEFVWNDDSLSCKVFPCEMQPDNLVGTAVMDICHLLRISGIRLFCFASGKRMVLFPERTVRKDGEWEFESITKIHDDAREMFISKLWQEYDKVNRRIEHDRNYRNEKR